MGYERAKRTIRLQFDDPEMAGLEVVTTSVPTNVFLGMVAIAQAGGRAITTADLAGVATLFDEFAEHLIEWNITQDGKPVPPTREGMGTQDTDFMLDVVMTWLSALGAASGPLALASSNGSTSG